MNIIRPYIEILQAPSYDEVKYMLELAIRNCYKSEDKITDNSAEKIIRRITKTGHASVLEHIGISVRLVCDRGILAELSRHRTGIAFSVESSRYCCYNKDKFGNEITCVIPYKLIGTHSENVFKSTMQTIEDNYLKMLEFTNNDTDSCRSLLPNALKTSIVCTANLREWLHIFSLRCDKPAHYQFRQLMLPFLEWCKNEYPCAFETMYESFNESILDNKKDSFKYIEIIDKRYGRN